MHREGSIRLSLHLKCLRAMVDKALCKQLGSNKEKKVEKLETACRSFVFGNTGHLKTLATYKIPVWLAGKEYKIKVVIINSGIPFLLSRVSMGKGKDGSQP